MKKIVCAALGILLGVSLLAGCGKEFEAESSMVYVDKKGAVTAYDLEELTRPDQEVDYYDEEGLEAYINETVDAYTEENGKGSVKVESFTVEGKTAKLKMKYQTAADYSAFNDVEMYQGKVVSSLAAGYVYDGDFVKVEDGKVTGTATKQEIYKEDDLKVVIIRANTDVKIEGEICYVSSQNVKLTGKDSVSIREGYLLSGSPSGELEIQGTVDLGGTESAVPETEEDRESEGSSVNLSGSHSFRSDIYTYIVYK